MSDNNQNTTTKTCTGDCLMCNMQQRIYCAAQMSRSMIDISSRIEKQNTEILERLAKIENSNSNTDGFINPMDGISCVENDDINSMIDESVSL